MMLDPVFLKHWNSSRQGMLEKAIFLKPSFFSSCFWVVWFWCLFVFPCCPICFSLSSQLIFLKLFKANIFDRGEISWKINLLDFCVSERTLYTNSRSSFKRDREYADAFRKQWKAWRKVLSAPRRSDPVVTEYIQLLILWHVNTGCQSHNCNIMEAQYKGPTI